MDKPRLVPVTYLCYGCRRTTTFRFLPEQAIRKSMAFTCLKCGSYHLHHRFDRRPLTRGSNHG